MRKTSRRTTGKTAPDRTQAQFAGQVVEAGLWTWTNPLDRLVDVLDRAVARARLKTVSSDLTGN